MKWALEHYGPIVAGVPVKVREVQISPRNGRGAVRSLWAGQRLEQPRSRVSLMGTALLPGRDWSSQLQSPSLLRPVFHPAKAVYPGSREVAAKGSVPLSPPCRSVTLFREEGDR